MTAFSSAPTPSPAPTNAPTPCLYFLPCAAATGPLAGLCKVGIAESFPARLAQLRAVWGEFNLERAALLRGGSRCEVRHLELALRHVFGHLDAERAARQAGKTLTNADYVAMDSGRRHPGREDEGHTEFFAAECLPEMLAFVEFWLQCRGPRAASASLQRGLTPADGALRLEADGRVTPTLSRGERRERRAREHAQWQREKEALHALRAGKVRGLLDLALAFEEHVVWVDLSRWRRARARPELDIGFADGLADLYLDGFGPAPFADDWGQRPAALRRLRAGFEQIEVPVTTWPEPWNLRARLEREVQRQRVVRWQEPPLDQFSVAVPPARCRQALRLRLGLLHNAPAWGFYDGFAALAERVEVRGRWEQPDLLSSSAQS